MTRIAELLPFAILQGTERKSDTDYNQAACDDYNSQYGSLDKEDSISCDYCRNKGEVWFVRDGGLCSSRCPQCTNVRQSMRLLRNSGLDSHTFDSFGTTFSWQEKIYDLVTDYAENSSGEWLYLGGQSGCGKTHLCTAALHKMILDRQYSVVLFKWAEVSKVLKGLVNDGEVYAERFSRYKNAQVLYIDDFFKIKKGETIKPADINLAFELIDHRCCMKLKTIISSEFSLDEIISADEATGGRIRQMCGKYALSVRPDQSKNFRLRENAS